jgi:hypothetical protein
MRSSSCWRSSSDTAQNGGDGALSSNVSATFESAAFRIAREFIRQDLDRHIAFERGVVSPIYLAHTAAVEQRSDLVRPQLLQLLANLQRHAS